MDELIGKGLDVWLSYIIAAESFVAPGWAILWPSFCRIYYYMVSTTEVLPPSRYCSFKELTWIDFSVSVKGSELPETLEVRVDLVIQAVVEEVRASVAPHWSLLRAHGMFSFRLSESSSPLKALTGMPLV